MKSVLILEDDVQFAYDFDARLQKAMAACPDFDMLFLNGTDTKRPYKVNQFVSKVTCTWGAFAYVVSEKIYDTLIELLEQGKDRVDGYYTKLQPTITAYKTNEKLVLHKAGYSYLAGFVTDHKHLR